MQLQNKNIIPLFSTPVYHCNVKDYVNDVVNFDNIDWSEYYVSNKQQNTNVSINQNVLELPKFATCKKIIDFAMKEFFYKELKICKRIKPKLVSSWMLIGHPNSTTASHLHTNALFSGVFYIKSEKNAGNIKLLSNPLTPTLTPYVIRLETEEYNLLNSLSWELELKTNDIIIFPSHLHHEVSENLSGQIRCGIAFNYMVTGQISNINTRVLKL